MRTFQFVFLLKGFLIVNPVSSMKSIPVIFINSKAKILSLKSLEILSKTNNTSAKSVIDKKIEIGSFGIGNVFNIVEDESMLLWSNRISQSSLEKWIPKYLFTDRYGQLSITGLHGMSGHNFTIAEETDKFIDDGHNGYWGNIYAAKMIADELLKRGDVDKLKEVDFPTREEIKERVLENINNIPKPKLI